MTVIVIAALVVAFLFGSRLIFSGKFRSISAQEAQRLVAERKLFILDVRTPGEYAHGRMKGAVLIPMAEVGRVTEKIPRDKPVLIYCASGARSRMAASILSRKGYGELFNLSGGIHAWQRAGFPVQKS